MGQSQAAADRLPWLPDDPLPQAKLGRGALLAWAMAAILAVAAASYWLGMRSNEQPPGPKSATAHSTTTVKLPEPAAIAPAQPQVEFKAAPEVNPPAARDVPISAPRPEKRSIARPAQPSQPEAPAAVDKTVVVQPPVTTSAKPAVNPDSRPLTVWPAWQSRGAKGRIVRIGAFGSRAQAKLGWRHMVTAYPAVAHLKATVVADRNSRGRRYYRFQIGTTSQAHSEVLCQRMEKIALSCAVVGLPGKPKGVER
jgi:hypothetical protein